MPGLLGDPYGTWGNLSRYIGTTKPDLSNLPPEIAAQLQDEIRVDEGGTQTHNYSFNQNPWGGFRGADGQYYVQVGDPNSNNASDGGIKDKSRVTYQPGAGYVTTPDNLNDHGIGGIDWRMVAAVVGAGLAGGTMGLGADAAGGAGGGLPAGYGSMTGVAGDESAGLLGTGSYAGGGAGSGLGGSIAAGGGDESAGLLGTGGGGTSGASGGMLGSSGAGTGAAGTPWYQPAINYVSNPMNAARLGLGLYSMATANNQHPGSGVAGQNGGPGGVADVTGLQQFNPLQAMGQFQQNQFLARQLQGMPFMGGR